MLPFEHKQQYQSYNAYKVTMQTTVTKFKAKEDICF